MTDPDVEREIEANKARARDAEPTEGDDGPIVDTLETTVAPFTRGMVNDLNDEEDGRQDDHDRSLLQKAKDAASSPE